ncbi:MAG: response regulator transcription factor [Gemmatimonadetes bacterium]|nr:response regulator transcription factor [Gemmatimonadota bacterium]
MRLLLVDDDIRFSAMLTRALGNEGYAVDTAWSVAVASRKLDQARYDSIVLDLGLPDRPGIDVCRTLRAKQDATPVLVISALASAEERIASLDAGADDYLVKPFHLGELKARLRALTRRERGFVVTEHRLGNLVVSVPHRIVRVDGQELTLTRKEFAILVQLMTVDGGVVSRAELGHRLWGDRFDEDSRALEVHINNLRSKLRGAGAEARIENRRALGYRLVADAQDPPLENDLAVAADPESRATLPRAEN